MSNTSALLPKQVLRLCALGTLLLRGPLSYAALASGVRDFTSHLIGPSLEMMGSSVELLRYEGLIEGPPSEKGADTGTGRLEVTDAGRAEFLSLMAAPVGLSLSDSSRLVVTLKIRFLHLLPVEDQRNEANKLAEFFSLELARLRDLHDRHIDEPGHLSAWLDHDIAQTKRRLAWFEGLSTELEPDTPQ